MTLAGGFLFGTWEGGGLVVIAATIGATIIFLAARTAPVRSHSGRRVGARMRAMEEGFAKNAFNYLLVLRLIPVFPFFLVNLGGRAAGRAAGAPMCWRRASASFRAPSSMPGSATGWARSSMPAARPIWA